MLRAVPEDERPAIVRAALGHPLVLLLVAGAGMICLPLYLDFMFALLNVEREPVIILMLAKIAGIMLLPIAVAVPLLSRFIMPRFIRKEMEKRGYGDSLNRNRPFSSDEH